MAETLKGRRRRSTPEPYSVGNLRALRALPPTGPARPRRRSKPIDSMGRTARKALVTNTFAGERAGRAGRTSRRPVGPSNGAGLDALPVTVQGESRPRERRSCEE